MQPSLTPENIRKPYGFPMFSAVEKGCIGNKWVNYHPDINQYNINTSIIQKSVCANTLC